MSKRIKMAVRPQSKMEADHWVENRNQELPPEPAKKPKRLTINIDPDLHTELKIHCATHRIQIADLIRSLIEMEVR